VSDIVLGGDANWSTCNTGATPPGGGDNVYLNGHTLNLDGANSSTYTCALIKACQADGTTLTNSIITLANAISTITANLFSGTTNSLITLAGNKTLTINGSLQAGTISVLTISAGANTVAVNGTATGGSAAGAYGISVGADTTFSVTNLTGGSFAGADGIIVNSVNAVVTVTLLKGGSVFGAVGALVNQGTLIINGTDVTGVAYCFSCSQGATVKIADGVKLAFSDKTSGLIKFYAPSLLPAVTTVLLNTSYGGADFLGTFDEDTRNVDPTIAKVSLGTHYTIHGSAMIGIAPAGGGRVIGG
jgi:hypothetical protein